MTATAGRPSTTTSRDGGAADVDPRDPQLRLATFFDDGTLELITPRDDSGMLAGRGTVGGTPAVAFASDATIQGGAMGEAGCAVVLAAYERALADGVPVIGLWHSGGARLREGVVSLHAVGQVFAIMTRASGRIPQISVVIGAAAGGAAYGPALTDIVILGPDGRVFVTGPDVVRSVTGESLTTRSNTVTFRGLQVAFGECGRVSSGEGVRVARSEAPNDAPERRRPGRRSAHMSDRRNVRACGRQERVGVSSV